MLPETSSGRNSPEIFMFRRTGFDPPRAYEWWGSVLLPNKGLYLVVIHGVHHVLPGDACICTHVRYSGRGSIDRLSSSHILSLPVLSTRRLANRSHQSIKIAYLHILITTFPFDRIEQRTICQTSRCTRRQSDWPAGPTSQSQVTVYPESHVSCSLPRDLKLNSCPPGATESTPSPVAVAF